MERENLTPWWKWKPSPQQARLWLVPETTLCNSRPKRLTHMWYTDIHSGRTPTRMKQKQDRKHFLKGIKEKEKRREEKKEKQYCGKKAGWGWVSPQSRSRGGAVRASGYWYFLSCTGKATFKSYENSGAGSALSTTLLLGSQAKRELKAATLS